MAADDDKPVASAETETPSGIVARLRQRLPERLTQFFQSRRSVGIAAAVASLTIVGLWIVLQPKEAPPEEQLQQALQLLADPLDSEARQEAAEISRKLRSLGYNDPDFPGGPAYVLGITIFRDAHDQDARASDQEYLRALRYLREAERSAFDMKYRPEFAFAMGVSLHRVGASEDAVPLLQEAIETYPRGKIEASTRLAEIYLDRKRPAELRRAVELTNSVLKSPKLSSMEKDRLHLRKARIHLALNQNELAQEALKSVSNATSNTHATKVFRAQTLMANAEMMASGKGMPAVSPTASLVFRQLAEDRFRAAREELKPVAEVVRLDQTFPRQALFLQGICSQRIGEVDAENDSPSKFDSAINTYSRVIDRYGNSHEGVAASLRLANLLRASDRDEEALLAYANALATVKSAQRFRNRWVSLNEFRSQVLNAWNVWARQGDFQSAIKLSTHMSPLIPEVQALELLALANRRWSERLAREIPSLPYSVRKVKRQQMRELSRAAGEAYARLAKLVMTTSRYPDMLWDSAEYYHKGYAFEKALDQLTRFINLRPRSKLALAIVRRGQVLMDLGRFKEAKEHFQRAIDLYPTDPASFTAQFEIAKCHLELGDSALAEQTWRNILSSNRLTPDATEWRRSLLWLSRTLFQSAVMIHEKAEKKSKGVATEEYLQQLKLAVTKWDESQRRLMEYLGRYPNADDIDEARFLLAKTLQQRAQLPRHLLKDAEVENVKIELRRNMFTLLNAARDEYRQLQTRLLRREEGDLLDSLEQRILRDCYFEIGHICFALGEYRRAIVAYNSAANRYSRDPQVLLAYLQMANCNDRLGEHGEALSMLVQAKVILRQLPDEAFQSGTSGLTKKQWETWLDWARRMRRTPNRPPRLLPDTNGST